MNKCRPVFRVKKGVRALRKELWECKIILAGSGFLEEAGWVELGGHEDLDM